MIRLIIACTISLMVGGLVGEMVGSDGKERMRAQAKEALALTKSSQDLTQVCIDKSKVVVERLDTCTKMLETSFSTLDSQSIVINSMIDMLWDWSWERIQTLRELPKFEHLDMLPREGAIDIDGVLDFDGTLDIDGNTPL